MVRRLWFLYKVVSIKQSTYLDDLIPPFQMSSWNNGYISEPFCRTVSFRNSLLLYAIKEWNKVDSKIRINEIYPSFRSKLLNFIRPTGNSTYKFYDLLGIKLFTRFWLGFSHLLEHKFRYNFANSLNPLSSCSLRTESTHHYFYAAAIILLYTESSWLN